MFNNINANKHYFGNNLVNRIFYNRNMIFDSKVWHPSIWLYRNFLTNQTLNHSVGPEAFFYRGNFNSSINETNTLSAFGGATFFNSEGNIEQVTVPDSPRFDYDPFTLEPQGLLLEYPFSRNCLNLGPWGLSSSIERYYQFKSITPGVTSFEFEAGTPNGIGYVGIVSFYGTGNVLLSSNTSTTPLTLTGVNSFPSRVTRSLSTNYISTSSTIISVSAYGDVQYFQFEVNNSTGVAPLPRSVKYNSIGTYPDTFSLSGINLPLSGTVFYEAAFDKFDTLSFTGTDFSILALLDTTAPENNTLTLQALKIGFGVPELLRNYLAISTISNGGSEKFYSLSSTNLPVSGLFYPSMSAMAGVLVDKPIIKFAIAYKPDQFTCYVNGMSGGTFNYDIPTQFNFLNFGTPNYWGSRKHIRQLAIYSSYLENDVLQSLTTTVTS